MFQRRSSAKNNLSRNDFKQKKKYWCDIIHIQQQPTMLLLNLSTFLYNNCLISRALIGSFLSSIRVQTGKILIYASFQPFNFQLSNCQLLNQWHFIDFFMLLIKKREKLSTMSASFWIKFTYLCLRQDYGVFSFICSLHMTILGSCYRKNQIDLSFLCVCPLIDNKLRYNIVKIYCRTTRLRLVKR